MIMTNKMEEMYKEAFLAISSCYPVICFWELWKIEKNSVMMASIWPGYARRPQSVNQRNN